MSIRLLAYLPAGLALLLTTLYAFAAEPLADMLEVGRSGFLWRPLHCFGPMWILFGLGAGVLAKRGRPKIAMGLVSVPLVVILASAVFAAQMPAKSGALITDPDQRAALESVMWRSVGSELLASFVLALSVVLATVFVSRRAASASNLE